MPGRYALFDKEGREEAEQAVDAAIRGFSETYEQIRKDFPGVGLGDTMTDEMVARVLYLHTHFGDEPADDMPLLWREPTNAPTPLAN